MTPYLPKSYNVHTMTRVDRKEGKVDSWCTFYTFHRTITNVSRGISGRKRARACTKLQILETRVEARSGGGPMAVCRTQSRGTLYIVAFHSTEMALHAQARETKTGD